MRDALLLNSSWQIQQVWLSTSLEFSSVNKENNIPDCLPPSVEDDSRWCLFSWKHVWSCWFFLKKLSLVCIPSCRLQVDERLKNFSQCLHLYGFSPVWVRSCFLQFGDWLKHFLQCLHLYGFSLVWIRSCCLQCPNWLKHLLQYLHVYGFSPVWVRSCCLKADNLLKNLPQCSHSCAISCIFVLVLVRRVWLA